MKREYIITGRKRGTKKWVEFGYKPEPRCEGEERRTWRPDLDNIAGAMSLHRTWRPDWEFRAVRI